MNNLVLTNLPINVHTTQDVIYKLKLVDDLRVARGCLVIGVFKHRGRGEGTENAETLCELCVSSGLSVFK